MAEEKAKMTKHILVLKASAWKKPLSFPLTFYWPKVVGWPYLTSDWQDMNPTQWLEGAGFSRDHQSPPVIQGKHLTQSWEYKQFLNIVISIDFLSTRCQEDKY